jgi:PPOX class probable F420-dependent enzyme
VPELSADQARLLEEPNFATVATLNRDGSLQLSIVWIDWDGEYVLFNTAAGRAKPRNLERDPQVSALVLDRRDGYRWVAVRGTAELTTEGADEHIDRLARKYTGAGWQPRPGERRLVVRFRPKHVSAYGF